MSSFPKIPLARAKVIAERFMNYLEPHVKRMSVSGGIRREIEFVEYIEIVCCPKDEFSLGRIFPVGYSGMVVNGSRLKRFSYPNKQIQIELHICEEREFGRMLAIYTGSSAYARIQFAVRLNRMGFCGTEDGLRRKSECEKKGNVWRIKPQYKSCPTLPPAFETEESFFAFLGVPWVSPRERSWVSRHKELNYNV